MPLFAVINEGIVENCVVADSLEVAEELTGKVCVEYTLESPVGIGFTYADGVFTNPNAVVLEEAPAPTEEE